MAAAIAGLGLTDAFDVIYGSSAGSVIGAYMVRYDHHCLSPFGFTTQYETTH
jgi:hypothetical protein